MSSNELNSNSPNQIDILKKSLGVLDVRRKSLEMESDAITSELTTSPGNDDNGNPITPMGVDTPLVDQDGYPRADVDVYRARTLRNRLAIIRTDHEELMKQINTNLIQLSALQNPNKVQEEKEEYERRLQRKPKPKYDPTTGKWVVMNWDGSVAGVPNGDKRSFNHLDGKEEKDQEVVDAAAISSLSITAAASSSTNNDSNNEIENNNNEILRLGQLRPFAKVNSIAPESPAEESGLKVNDLILEFGSINYDTPNTFQEVAQCVPKAATENQSITIAVSREVTVVRETTTGFNTNTITTVSLKPRPWAGRGLIGCHIVPYTD